MSYILYNVIDDRRHDEKSKWNELFLIMPNMLLLVEREFSFKIRAVLMFLLDIKSIRYKLCTPHKLSNFHDTKNATRLCDETSYVIVS